MIDIHNHILPDIDDGSSGIDTSIFLLKRAKELGVNRIICTPHYTRQIYNNNYNVIKESFSEFIKYASELDIELYMGQEIMCYKANDLLEMIPNNEIVPLADSRYLLLEFEYTTYIDISEVVYNASLFDYGVIIAHIERYQYLDIEEIKYLKRMGALVQVNAESIVKPFDYRSRRIIKKLLDNNLVDFIASDTHHNRINYMQKAFCKIQKKYGIERANKLFKENAEWYLIRTNK